MNIQGRFFGMEADLLRLEPHRTQCRGFYALSDLSRLSFQARTIAEPLTRAGYKSKMATRLRLAAEVA